MTCREAAVYTRGGDLTRVDAAVPSLVTGGGHELPRLVWAWPSQIEERLPRPADRVGSFTASAVVGSAESGSTPCFHPLTRLFLCILPCERGSRSQLRG